MADSSESESKVKANLKLEDLLLDDARRRCEAEDTLNNTYQAKTAFLLAFSGGFAALLGQLFLALTKQEASAPIDGFILAILSLGFILLFFGVALLLHSSLATGYGALASPEDWQSRLEEVRRELPDSPDRDEVLYLRILEGYRRAWAQAATSRIKANAKKASVIARSIKFLHAVVGSTALILCLMGGRWIVAGKVIMSNNKTEQPVTTEAPAATPASSPETPVPSAPSQQPRPTIWPPNIVTERTYTGGEPRRRSR